PPPERAPRDQPCRGRGLGRTECSDPDPNPEPDPPQDERQTAEQEDRDRRKRPEEGLPHHPAPEPAEQGQQELAPLPKEADVRTLLAVHSRHRYVLSLRLDDVQVHEQVALEGVGAAEAAG